MARSDFPMSTPACESPVEHYPRGSVVARVLLSTNPSVYAPMDESLAHAGREQEMIQAHPLVQGPPIALVIPERPERPLGVQFSQSVRPALGQQARIRLAALRLNQRVLIERSRWINILLSRHYVVVAGQDHRHAGIHEFRAVLDLALEPGQFVIELRTRLR